MAVKRVGHLFSWIESLGLVDKDLVPKGGVNMEHIEPETQSMKFWWVNMGQKYKPQREGGFMWAPLTNKIGNQVGHYSELANAEVGDVVIVYGKPEIKSIGIVSEKAKVEQKPASLADENWNEKGNLVKLDYYDLEQWIPKDSIPSPWRSEDAGPFDRNGNLKQGYFYPVSEDFMKKFYPQYKDLMSPVVQEHIERAIEFEETSMMNEQELMDHIHSYITSKGFTYEKDDIINFYLSLKTKPFVILSGISGTGKTKIVQWFSESIGATGENGRFLLIPVRPDWSDSSDLLGYTDIQGKFKKEILTEFLMKAAADEDKPYFVLLDEMNLARVEYYFSDILSVMESRKWENGRIITSQLLSEKEVDGGLTIPSNVYFIGTVNMDETTHPFSKKVLDRANTIEFNRIQLDNFSFLQEGQMQSITVGNDALAGSYLFLKDAFTEHETLIHSVTEKLMSVNVILQDIGAQVGYRVRDEVCFYMIYNAQSGLLNEDDAFDFQLMQKILPRIHGSDIRTEVVLKKLFRYCTNQEVDADATRDEGFYKRVTYPKTARKLTEMSRRFEQDGFTSFWL